MRGRTVSLLLYRALYCTRCGQVEHVVTAMDRHAHGVLLALGVPFVPVCDSEPIDYMGSPCTALYGPPQRAGRTAAADADVTAAATPPSTSLASPSPPQP